METALFIIGIIVVVILAVFVIPYFMTRRAVRQVVRMFQRSGAIGIRDAKPAEEIGLKVQSTSMMQRMFSRRDYKGPALDTLIQLEVVQVTNDGKLYLSEEKLFSSGLDRQLR